MKDGEEGGMEDRERRESRKEKRKEGLMEERGGLGMLRCSVIPIFHLQYVFKCLFTFFALSSGFVLLQTFTFPSL